VRACDRRANNNRWRKGKVNHEPKTRRDSRLISPSLDTCIHMTVSNRKDTAMKKLLLTCPTALVFVVSLAQVRGFAQGGSEEDTTVFFKSSGLSTGAV
jgi:hypothetical protein